MYKQPDTPITWLHFHDVTELGYCHEGHGIFVVGEKILGFGAGDIILITSREVHLAQSVKGTTSLWTWVYLDTLKLLGPRFDDYVTPDVASYAGPHFCNVFSQRSHPELTGFLRDAITRIRADGKKAAHDVEALLYLFFSRLYRLHVRTAMRLDKRNSTAGDAAEMQRVMPALEYIGKHYAEELRIADLARRCFMSATNFRRHFNRTLGRGPCGYIIQLRLKMASAELRSTQKPVSSIARDCGFGTLSSFNREFKKEYGVSPRQWRKA